MVRCTRTTSCDRVCRWLVAGRWFSLGAPVSSASGAGSRDMAEVWLKVVLNTITLPYWSLLKIWCLFLPLSGELFLIQLYVITTLCDYNFMWLQLYVITTLCDYNFMWLQLYVIISIIIVVYSSFPHQ